VKLPDSVLKRVGDPEAKDEQVSIVFELQSRITSESGLLCRAHIHVKLTEKAYSNLLYSSKT